MTSMPMISPACTSRLVSSTSSRLGVGSPDGWLWNSTIAAAHAEAASRKISRGCAGLESSVPTETTDVRMSRCFVSSIISAELLDRACAELRQQVGGGVARIHELKPGRRTPKQRSAPKLDGGEHLRRLRRPHAVEPAQFVHRRARHPVEPACRFQDVVGERQRIGAPRAAADDDGHQLVVAESGGAETQQLFARPIVHRERFHGGSRGILN